MNASPVSASTSVSGRSQSKPRSKGGNWIFSLTGVCFIFGGLLAMQIRAIQQVHADKQFQAQTNAVRTKQVEQLRQEAVKAQAVQAAKDAKIRDLQKALASGANLTKNQLAVLNSQIKDLQRIAGLTPITGAGVRLVLSDNPNAGEAAGETAFLPGLVHDYDLQQVVNEFRAAKADAIAIKGAGAEVIRVTGYTPIRCVGPVIYVNWKPVAAPFTIEAIGDPETLKSALAMPNGMIDQLKNNGAIGVKMTVLKNTTVPPAEGSASTTLVARATTDTP